MLTDGYDEGKYFSKRYSANTPLSIAVAASDTGKRPRADADEQRKFIDFFAETVQKF